MDLPSAEQLLAQHKATMASLSADQARAVDIDFQARAQSTFTAPSVNRRLEQHFAGEADRIARRMGRPL